MHAIPLKTVRNLLPSMSHTRSPSLARSVFLFVGKKTVINLLRFEIVRK